MRKIQANFVFTHSPELLRYRIGSSVTHVLNLTTLIREHSSGQMMHAVIEKGLTIPNAVILERDIPKPQSQK